MAESTIITGQFVRISQTPASIGERLLALVIDYSLIVIYLYSVTTLIVKLHLSSGVGTYFFTRSSAKCSITGRVSENA